MTTANSTTTQNNTAVANVPVVATVTASGEDVNSSVFQSPPGPFVSLTQSAAVQTDVPYTLAFNVASLQYVRSQNRSIPAPCGSTATLLCVTISDCTYRTRYQHYSVCGAPTAGLPTHGGGGLTTDGANFGTGFHTTLSVCDVEPIVITYTNSMIVFIVPPGPAGLLINIVLVVDGVLAKADSVVVPNQAPPNFIRSARALGRPKVASA